mgnify:CR=1 FL=1
MAVQEANVKNQDILNHLGKMERPIPGQSLTSNPDEPRPWEKPTTYVKLKDALYGLFNMMTEETMYTNIVGALSDGMPVVNLTQMILTDGFQKGAWNPDLMLELIEPTMYMVMSMAEKVGVKYRIDMEDNPNIEEADSDKELKLFNEFEKAVKIKATKIDESAIPREIKAELAKVQVPQSLLERGSDIEQNDNSLLTRGEI